MIAPIKNARLQTLATVITNRQLCREHFQLDLRVDFFPPTFPGQFIQLECRPPHMEFDLPDHEWADGKPPKFLGEEFSHPLAVLRRPFSLAGRRNNPDGSVVLEIIHRVVGVGTDWLSKLSPGDQANLIGPLGNGFTLPKKGQTAILVGGGVGIPPMIYLGVYVAGIAVAICGAMTAGLLPLQVFAEDADPAGIRPDFCAEPFFSYVIPSIITTDDGSAGYPGFVTQALEKYLNANPNGDFVIYTCGPEPMMKRVAEIALARNIECQIAVERAMACGMGTCQSCVIKVKTPAGEIYKLACTDGPVFNAADLRW